MYRNRRKTQKKKGKAKASGYTSGTASEISPDEGNLKLKNKKDNGKSNNRDVDKTTKNIRKHAEEKIMNVEEEEVEEEEEEENEDVIEEKVDMVPPAPAVQLDGLKNAKKKTESLEEAEVAENSSPALESSTYDGWAVKEKKQKKKQDLNDSFVEEQSITTVPVDNIEPLASEKLEEEDEEFEEQPPVDFVTEELVVETKKLGLLIGTKGITRIGIQNITGAEILMPKTTTNSASMSTIAVKGTAAAVKEACVALKELCSKGYAQILVPADFVESTVTVHHKCLPDIIGKGGSSIKAIQTATGVKISIPTVGPRGPPPGASNKVKVNVAGIREQVSIARKTILELTKYFHTEMTHPGYIHTELDIPENYYSYIIGPKGAEIKNIQSTCKVTVHIPNDETFVQNVLIVGEPQNVCAAEEMVKKIVQRVDNLAIERAAAEAAELAKWGPGATARTTAHNSSGSLSAENSTSDSPVQIADSGAPDDQWMKTFS